MNSYMGKNKKKLFFKTIFKKIQVPVSDVLCTEYNKYRALSIPIPTLSWFESKLTCDKYRMDSMAGPFEVT